MTTSPDANQPAAQDKKLRKKGTHGGDFVDPLDPSKRIAGTCVGVGDFWQWAYSDIGSGTLRGDLAEFLVRTALFRTQPDAYPTRKVMDHVDFEWFPSEENFELVGDRRSFWLEVKSSVQRMDSEGNVVAKGKEQYGVEEHEGWDRHSPEFPIVKLKRLWADLYVFCRLTVKAPYDRIESALHYANWRFLVVPTYALVEEIRKQPDPEPEEIASNETRSKPGRKRTKQESLIDAYVSNRQDCIGFYYLLEELEKLVKNPESLKLILERMKENEMELAKERWPSSKDKASTAPDQ